MGAVWLGRDEVLNRPVALKRVGATPDAPAPDLTRAEREARLAASLNHPHVVAIYDLVHDGDDRWLVMEYVAGETLSAMVRREGPLSHDRAAALLGQAAEALAAAHSAGIVHRDVKPSNILVTAADRVKLTDFGIARAAADATLTQTGLVTGSPAYLAPEVATGKPATDRSDVWSLGTTLYHALAGRPPYDVGDNVMGALYRIVHEDPPRLADAGWLAPVLEATMATDPADRWSMREVARYLAAGPGAAEPEPDATRSMATLGAASPVPVEEREATPAHDEPAPPDDESADEPPRKRRGVSPVLLGLLAAAVVAAAVVLFLQTREDPGAGPTAGGTTSASPSPTASETPSPTSSESPSESPTQSPSPSETSETPDQQAEAAAMEGFASDYLSTVTSDPQASWERLTPAFQRQSGGFESYNGFWSGISRANVLDITADPGSDTVTYSVEYTRNDGSTITDVVTLDLQPAGDSFLIAGES